MTGYQVPPPGDATVPPTFFDGPGCAVCGVVLSAMGFLSQELYPALGFAAMILSMVASGLSIHRYFQIQRDVKKESEDI